MKAHPESFQLDAKTGRIFVNVPKNGAIEVIDRRSGQQIASWATASRRANFAMALDHVRDRVLVAFRRPAELGVFTLDGKLVASVPTCGDVDDIFVDAKRDRIYVSCGEGFVDVLTGDEILPAKRICDRTRRSHLAVRAGARSFSAGRPGEGESGSGNLGFSSLALRCRGGAIMADGCLVLQCAAASLIFFGVAGGSSPAFAYRPFDGTDAAVAAPGELEVELQPAGVQQEQGTRTLIAPWTVLNIGLSEGWEAVFEGRGETPLSPSGPIELTTGRGIPQACRGARRPSGQSRTERCDRIRGAAAGQHGRQRGWRQLGRNRFAALGLGNNALQRRDRTDAGPSRRCLCRHNYRGPDQMESAASRGILLRKGFQCRSRPFQDWSD